MRLRHLLVLPLLLAASQVRSEFRDCLHFDGVDGEEAGTPTEWRGNLRVHNCVRRSALPTPSPALGNLGWSASLAATAQNYANQCIWAHSGTPNVGENLFARAPHADARTAAANSWADEFGFYNYAANSCAAGEQCGHYTQMVWRNTNQMGCGMTNCNTGSPFGASFPQWTIVVCQYSPPGNYFGERPY